MPETLERGVFAAPWNARDGSTELVAITRDGRRLASATVPPDGNFRLTIQRLQALLTRFDPDPQ